MSDPSRSVGLFPRSRIHALAVVVILMLGVSCGSATSPDNAQTYKLVTIDGAALPVGDKLSPGSMITDGTVDFIASDSAAVLEVSQGGLTVIRDDRVHVNRSGSTFVFTSSARSNAPDTASISGRQLVLRHHVQSVGASAVEVRVYTTR